MAAKRMLSTFAKSLRTAVKFLKAAIPLGVLTPWAMASVRHLASHCISASYKHICRSGPTDLRKENHKCKGPHQMVSSGFIDVITRALTDSTVSASRTTSAKEGLSLGAAPAFATCVPTPSLFFGMLALLSLCHVPSFQERWTDAPTRLLQLPETRWERRKHTNNVLSPHAAAQDSTQHMHLCIYADQTITKTCRSAESCC